MNNVETIPKNPKHVAFIMDGNRRWARAHSLPTLEGHRRGYDKMKSVGDWCLKRGITTMTVYAFSTENWNRDKDEVYYLMALLHEGLTKELNEFNTRGIRVRVIGRRKGLPENVRRATEVAEEQTRNNTKGTLYLAINYGGRAEIIDAAKSLLQSNASVDDITEETFAQYLYAPEAPEPDLIIRTSGEQRLSGFLLWQAAYSELYFTPTFWPDFDEEELDRALVWYASRTRRFGTG